MLEFLQNYGDWILFGISGLFTLTIVLFVFFKVTPSNAPDNLVGLFFGTLKIAIVAIVLFYVLGFLFKFFVG